MTEIILVRHGETQWNIGEIFRGRVDVELNETGIRQAELLGEYLSGTRIEAIYSSPLNRALRTAEKVASYHGLDARIAPGLIDLDYGKWQGLPHQEVKEKYPELYAAWVHSPHQVTMPGGESLDNVRERAMVVVNAAIVRHEGTVVMVAHRVVNKVLICALLGLDNSRFWDIRQDTCGMTTFVYQDKRFILTGHNNTSYLKPLQKVPLGDF